MSYCAGCGARLRRSKPSWASCDPCQEKADRKAYAQKRAEEAAALEASPRCKRCGGQPIAAQRGSYARLCSPCRELARDEAKEAAS